MTAQRIAKIPAIRTLKSRRPDAALSAISLFDMPTTNPDWIRKSNFTRWSRKWTIRKPLARCGGALIVSTVGRILNLGCTAMLPADGIVPGRVGLLEHLADDCAFFDLFYTACWLTSGRMNRFRTPESKDKIAEE